MIGELWVWFANLRPLGVTRFRLEDGLSLFLAFVPVDLPVAAGFGPQRGRRTRPPGKTESWFRGGSATDAPSHGSVFDWYEVA